MSCPSHLAGVLWAPVNTEHLSGPGNVEMNEHGPTLKGAGPLVGERAEQVSWVKC